MIKTSHRISTQIRLAAKTEESWGKVERVKWKQIKNVRPDQGHRILNGCIPVYQHLEAHCQDNT